MKTLWIATTLALVSLFAYGVNQERVDQAPAAACQDQEADPFGEEPLRRHENPKMVQVQVEFIELSHEALTELLFKSKPTTSNATALRESLQTMVTRKQASVMETQIIICRSSEKATVESIHEFIYPTEYNSYPQPPTTEGDEESATPPPQVPTYTFGSAFEVRNTGSILEVEPVIGDDGQLIDLRFMPELIWHTGNTCWSEFKDLLGNTHKVEMPDFYLLRTRCAVTCISGQYTLAAVLSPKDKNGKVDMTSKVMVFVKCDVLEVRPDADKTADAATERKSG